MKRKRYSFEVGNIRFYFVFGILVLVWGALWSFSLYVQVIKGNTLKKRARSQHWKLERLVGKRGDILSRDGEILAKSILVKSVFASPKNMTKMEKMNAIKSLSKILKESRRYLWSKLNSNRSFVWIKRKIDDETVYKIKELSLPGIYLTEEAKRIYPKGSMLGQLIGFVGVDNKGLEGLEYKFDKYLSGEKKEFWVLKDALNHTLFAPDQLDESTKGKDLVLTIDTTIQAITERALMRSVEDFSARYGMALVVEVESGEILAWAQYPFFNPNRYEIYSPSVWKNRIAIDEFEPGSTIKPLLIASAIEKGVCDTNSVFFCENGRWRFCNHIINDTHKYGWLTVEKIVRYSSNICSGKIALKLGKKSYYEYLKKLGFGQKTSVPVPGQSDGFLEKYTKWTDIDLVAKGFGQGLSVTLLQLAKAYLCIANKGVLKPLVLIKKPHQQKEPPKRIFSESTSKKILSMLMGVVEFDGTGRLAKIKGIKIGGKTGTAQKATKWGYTNKYVASFVALVPALNPKYLIAVVVDEPKKAHYGGVVAAPVARYIAKELTVAEKEIATKYISTTAYKVDKNNETYDIESNFDIEVRTPSLTKKGRLKLAGMDVRSAVEVLLKRGIVPKIIGAGKVVVGYKKEGDTLFLITGDRMNVRSAL